MKIGYSNLTCPQSPIFHSEQGSFSHVICDTGLLPMGHLLPDTAIEEMVEDLCRQSTFLVFTPLPHVTLQ
jgi:hypothetical protein